MTHAARPAVERVHPPKGPYLVVNAVMRWLLADAGRAKRVGEHLLLLHLTGRRSGREITVPVAYRTTEGGPLLVLTNSVWRLNLRAASEVELTWHGRRRPATARLVEDPDEVAEVYGALIAATDPRKAGRRMGIRINVRRAPTHEELAEAARREGLSLVYLSPALVSA